MGAYIGALRAPIDHTLQQAWWLQGKNTGLLRFYATAFRHAFFAFFCVVHLKISKIQTQSQLTLAFIPILFVKLNDIH